MCGVGIDSSVCESECALCALPILSQQAPPVSRIIAAPTPEIDAQASTHRVNTGRTGRSDDHQGHTRFTPRMPSSSQLALCCDSQSLE